MELWDRILSKVMDISPVQRQSLISFFTLLAITLTGYVATMYFSHVLGPAILGSYFLFLAYFGIFNLIGDGGFGGAAAKRISEGSDKDQFFSAYVVLRICLVVVSILFLIVVSPFLVDLAQSSLFPWLIAALIIGTVSGIFSIAVYGSGMVGVSQISNLLNNIFKIGLQIAAVVLGYSAAGLAGGFIAGMIIGTVVNLHYFSIHFSRFGMNHLKSLFSYSFWIFLTSSGALVFSYADVILIGYFMSNADVGIYRIAFQLAGVSAFITTSLTYVLFPKISSWMAQQNTGAIENALSRAITYSLFLALPAALGGIVLSDQLLYFLYGSAFIAGADVLKILLVVQVCNVFMYILTMCLNAMNRPQDSFKTTSAAALVNIVVNVLLIPVMGMFGAAIGTLLAMIINALFAGYFVSQLIAIRLEKRSVTVILCSSVAMSIVVLLYRLVFSVESFPSLILAVLLAIAVYMVLIMKFEKTLPRELRDICCTLGIPVPGIFMG